MDFDFLLLFFSVYAVTVDPIFFSLPAALPNLIQLHSLPSPSQFPCWCLCPWAMHECSLVNPEKLQSQKAYKLWENNTGLKKKNKTVKQ